MTEFERWQHWGRIREMAKKADPYSLLFEHDGHLYVALSTGQNVQADKFITMTDRMIYNWLKLLVNSRYGRISS